MFVAVALPIEGKLVSSLKIYSKKKRAFGKSDNKAYLPAGY